MILVAGDCTGSAYLFAPKTASPTLVTPQTQALIQATTQGQAQGQSAEVASGVPQYELLYEIECGATVRHINALYF